MFHITSSQPVSWPTASPTTVAHVQPVQSVGRVRPSRDAQTDAGSNGQGTPPGGTAPAGLRSSSPSVRAGAPTAEPAPLLPRDRPEGESSAGEEELAKASADAEQRKVEEQKAREAAAQRPPMQEVISTVWKASAAVVESVLGQDGAAVQSDLPGIESIPAALRREQEPVAYTEQGTGRLASLEVGSLISQRV